MQQLSYINWDIFDAFGKLLAAFIAEITEIFGILKIKIGAIFHQIWPYNCIF